jgi:hypothetical protein
MAAIVPVEDTKVGVGGTAKPRRQNLQLFRQDAHLTRVIGGMQSSLSIGLGDMGNELHLIAEMMAMPSGTCCSTPVTG